MSEALSQLLRNYAAMTPADRRAIESRLGELARSALLACLQPARSQSARPAPEPRFSFEAYSPPVAKRLAEILVIDKAAVVTERTKTALAALVASSAAAEGPS